MYIGIFSPYPYTIGGGEKYLAMLMSYFISKGYTVVFFNNTKKDILFKTLTYYSIPNNKIIYQPMIDFKKKYFFDYFIYMNNSSVPEFKGLGEKNIYHCQFPMDLTKHYSHEEKIKNADIISSYQVFIVNSSFTKQYLSLAYSIYECQTPIFELNPICIDTLPVIKEKEKNSFVMIGRIFEPEPFSNNKWFDTAIRLFNELDSTLYLIGSVKSYAYLNYLKSIIKTPNIKILPDISEEEKNTILDKSEYFIQLTGINDTFVGCQEHFGIALIEAISHHCIPICFGGYATSLINNSNGYIINKENFKTKITEILKLEKKLSCTFDLKMYMKEHYTLTLETILDDTHANQN